MFPWLLLLFSCLFRSVRDDIEEEDDQVGVVVGVVAMDSRDLFGMLASDTFCFIKHTYIHIYVCVCVYVHNEPITP